MKSRLDINALGRQKRLHFYPFLFDDDQSEAAVVLNVPGPGDQLEPHPPIFHEGFGVHGLMGGVEQENEMRFGQGHSALGGWRGGHPASFI